jgi:dUTP pyrophosphatase
VVDSGYRGEVGVILWNVSDAHQVIEAGQKIAQLLILPVATPQVVTVTKLSEAERGAQGFGSSGV